MTAAADLTQGGYRSLREAVAHIIAGMGQGVVEPVTAEHRQAAERLIDANVIDIQKVLPGVH